MLGRTGAYAGIEVVFGERRDRILFHGSKNMCQECIAETKLTSFHNKHAREKGLIANFAYILGQDNMKLIVTTSPTFFVEEDKIITVLFEEGLDILHLRKPETPAMFSERLLTLIPQKYHKQIVTHEHFYLKEEFNLMGIHLNSRNQKEPHDYAGHVSCSCRSLEELKKKKHFYDYVFLKPIYDYDPGRSHFSKYTPEELREAVKENVIDSNVMAFGGINLENMLEIKDLGFGGAVVMEDLWHRFDVCNDKDYIALIDHFKLLKEMAD